jgi:hypothetical protein
MTRDELFIDLRARLYNALKEDLAFMEIVGVLETLKSVFIDATFKNLEKADEMIQITDNETIMMAFCIKNKMKYKPENFNVRADGRIEYVCEHSCGHTIYSPRGKSDFIHGCDSCCQNFKI